MFEMLKETTCSKINLKSMYKCRSYSPDKLIYVTFKCDLDLQPGLEKSLVLPVLDRFLSLKTDFVLKREAKNRSIKIPFFSVQFLKQSTIHTYQGNLQLTSHLNIRYLVLSICTHMYYMTSADHTDIQMKRVGPQHVGLKDWSVFVAFF